jgi:hypothetical protein
VELVAVSTCPLLGAVAAATSTEVVADLSAVALPVSDPVKVVAVILPVPVMVGEVRDRPESVEDHAARVDEDATNSWFALGAVAPLITTVVVAVLSPLATVAVVAVSAFPTSAPVKVVAVIVPVPVMVGEVRVRPARVDDHAARVEEEATNSWFALGAVAPLITTVVVAVFSPFATVAVVAVVASVAVSAFPTSAPVKVAAVIVPVPVIVGEVRVRPARVDDHAASTDDEATSS